MMNNIEHVVLVMFENRSFDSLLGWLYEHDQPSHVLGDPKQRPFEGLAHLNLKDYANPYVNHAHVTKTVFPAKVTSSGLTIPKVNPFEEYEHVNAQLYGSQSNPPSGKKAPMSGFAQDFYNKSGVPEQIMQSYTPQQLEALNTFAKNYAVCDYWYSSVPTQTNPNRAFLHCGTSLGRSSNLNFRAKETFETTTMWNLLTEHHISWRLYYHDIWADGRCYTDYTFPFARNGVDHAVNYRPCAEFRATARAGELPAFTFIEPSWYVGTRAGNDYHPPTPMIAAERFLATVVSALQYSRTAWNKTLLIITFDEHGGTFDHISPPWTAKSPDGKTDSTGFLFDRFGVRVPMVLMSPWIEERTVFRANKDSGEFDHTSIIKTICKWKGIDVGTRLGQRVAHAPTFEHVLTRSSPRMPDAGPDDVKFGEPLLLRTSGMYITPADLGVHYYARIGGPGYVNHTLETAEGHTGVIMNRMKLRIKSTEKALQKWDTLGTFKKPWNYYTVDEYGEQVFKIVKADDPDGKYPIKYSEPVQFYGDGDKRIGKYDVNYVAETNSEEPWFIVRSPEEFVVAKVVTRSGPTLALFNDEVWMSYILQNGNLHFQGVGDTGIYVDHRPPCAVQYRDRFYIVYSNPAGSGLEGRSTDDGHNFQPFTTPYHSAHGAALAVFEDKMWMVWVGIPAAGDKRLYYAQWNGQQWVGQSTVRAYVSDAQPALAVFNDRLYLAWKKADTAALYVTRWEGSDFSDPPTYLPVGTSAGPGFTAYGGESLRLVWKGQGDDLGIYSSLSNDGVTWAKQQGLAGLETGFGPGLVHHRGVLYVGWQANVIEGPAVCLRGYPTLA